MEKAFRKLSSKYPVGAPPIGPLLNRGVQLTLTLMSVSVFRSSLTWAWAFRSLTLIWAVGAHAHAHMSAHERERFILIEWEILPDHFYLLHSSQKRFSHFSYLGSPSGIVKNKFVFRNLELHIFIDLDMLISSIIMRTFKNFIFYMVPTSSWLNPQ